MKSIPFLCLIFLMLNQPDTANSVPMVENSVKFALERCKQFLSLAQYLKAKALKENEDLKRTKDVCEHIVQIEKLFDDEVKVRVVK